ncbi:MAG: hypothetical protein V5A36_08665 [Natronomonas sp.]
MTDDDPSFEAERQTAQELLSDDSVTAFYVGVVDEGETVDATFAQTAEDPQQEGLQTLSLLATHVRIVANQAGVDPATIAGDAATLAGRLDELSPEELAAIEADEEASTDG